MPRPVHLALMVAGLWILPGQARAQAPDSLSAAQAAFIQRRGFLLRDGGVWWAANPAFAPGKAGVASHFGYQFSEGYGPTSYRLKIVGRLGTETYLFWEGFYAWHPVRNAFMYHSLGTGGAVATGWSVNVEGDLVFDVVGPDGAVTTSLDREVVIGADEFRSASFQLVAGKWQPNQELTWKRERKTAG